MPTTAIARPEQPELLDDVVSTLVVLERTIHQLTAVRAALLATAHRIADDEPDIVDADSRELAHRAVASEIGAALRVNDRAIEGQMGDAARLVRDFPMTASAYEHGRLSPAHVRVILDAGSPIDDAEARQEFEAAVLPRALEESPNRLRPLAKQLSERFRAASFAERHAIAKAKRAVWVRDGDDGMSELGVLGPTVIIRGIFDRISQMAFAVKTENARAEVAHARGDGPAEPSADSPAAQSTDASADERSTSELRADLAADMLLTGVPHGHDTVDGQLGAIRASVEITVPVLTITDPMSSAPPAHLEGVGPIDPHTARVLVGSAAGWERVMTDPVSGAVLAVDRYRPTEQMRRYLRVRDRRCRFPGCRITARRCDDDHSVDHARGGATDVDNLAGKCRRHHVTKHHTAWRVLQHPGGVVEWTSPTGRTYIDRPPGVPGAVTFHEVDERLVAHANPDPGDTAPF
ncbi:MAG: DUF222 domain-containing protein [Actinomycetota bacterium]